ncbi:MAG TPA: universal stress protein [Kofleriaceae bacterium]|nr:universal stress protein [Kofleriaceae bacterium]
MAEHDEWKDDTVRRDPVRPIVVGLDFSAVSRLALAWALEYAARTPCEVHTVHVVDRRLHRGDLAADPTQLRNELAQVHAEAAAELKRQVDDDLRKQLLLHEHISIGSAADEILSVARDLNAGMIVVGSHGKGAVERLLVGSTAERVVRGSKCTVVVVRDR